MSQFNSYIQFQIWVGGKWKAGMCQAGEVTAQGGRGREGVGGKWEAGMCQAGHGGQREWEGETEAYHTAVM